MSINNIIDIMSINNIIDIIKINNIINIMTINIIIDIMSINNSIGIMSINNIMSMRPSISKASVIIPRSWSINVIIIMINDHLSPVYRDKICADVLDLIHEHQLRLAVLCVQLQPSKVILMRARRF